MKKVEMKKAILQDFRERFAEAIQKKDRKNKLLALQALDGELKAKIEELGHRMAQRHLRESMPVLKLQELSIQILELKKLQSHLSDLIYCCTMTTGGEKSSVSESQNDINYLARTNAMIDRFNNSLKGHNTRRKINFLNLLERAILAELNRDEAIESLEDDTRLSPGKDEIRLVDEQREGKGKEEDESPLNSMNSEEGSESEEKLDEAERQYGALSDALLGLLVDLEGFVGKADELYAQRRQIKPKSNQSQKNELDNVMSQLATKNSHCTNLINMAEEIIQQLLETQADIVSLKRQSLESNDEQLEEDRDLKSELAKLSGGKDRFKRECNALVEALRKVRKFVSEIQYLELKLSTSDKQSSALKLFGISKLDVAESEAKRAQEEMRVRDLKDLQEKVKDRDVQLRLVKTLAQTFREKEVEKISSIIDEDSHSVVSSSP